MRWGVVWYDAAGKTSEVQDRLNPLAGDRARVRRVYSSPAVISLSGPARALPTGREYGCVEGRRRENEGARGQQLRAHERDRARAARA